MYRAMPPYPQYVFMAWYSAKHRDNFTLRLPEIKSCSLLWRCSSCSEGYAFRMVS